MTIPLQTETSKSEAETRHDPARYMAVLAGTIIFLAAAFVAILWTLEAAKLKPPPAFTNSDCFDAKLEFLRKNPPVDPTHLIVGSSVAWRNLAGDAVVEQHPNAKPLNGAFCGLSINQSAFTARFFLERFPTITDVLLVLDPFDMSVCRSKKSALFDTADVSAYLSGAHDLSFYFKYFDAFSLMANAFGVKDVFTRHGDGPLKIDGRRGLVYGPPPALQAECDTALADLAAYVENTGRHLLVVTMPLLGEWSDKYDRDSKARTHLAETIRGALKGRSAKFWDAWSRLTLPAQDYTDAVHLRGSAAPGFTRQLVKATGFGS
jgi:hypothetical protein